MGHENSDIVLLTLVCFVRDNQCCNDVDVFFHHNRKVYREEYTGDQPLNTNCTC